ncbi:serine/threonine protein kinase [bacterium]|nr:serine/threonine protein kinase [bacterium]
MRLTAVGLCLLLAVQAGSEPAPRSLYFDCLPRDYQVAQYQGDHWEPCQRNQRNRIELTGLSKPLRFRLSRQGYQTAEIEVPASLWEKDLDARWPTRLNQIISLQPEVIYATFATEPSGAQVYLSLPGGGYEYLGLSGAPVALNLARVTGGSAGGQFEVEFRKVGYSSLKVPVGSYALDAGHTRWPASGRLPLPRRGPAWQWLVAPLALLGLGGWLHGRGAGEKRPSVQVGEYLVEETLGYGASGKVLRARHRRSGRRVALKLLHPRLADDPHQLAAFRQEASLLAQLDHPNVVRVLEWGEDLGRPYLAMELVEGADLRTALSVDPLGGERLCQLLAQAAAGMDWTHRQGIVHRDIKPENLIITPKGRACWVDFGLAERNPQAADASGTRGYLAPERLLGQAATPASDQWALGALAYEALTGQLPGSAPDLRAFRPHLKPALVAVVERMLQSDPKDRFASLAEVEKACLAL